MGDGRDGSDGRDKRTHNWNSIIRLKGTTTTHNGSISTKRTSMTTLSLTLSPSLLITALPGFLQFQTVVTRRGHPPTWWHCHIPFPHRKTCPKLKIKNWPIARTSFPSVLRRHEQPESTCGAQHFNRITTLHYMPISLSYFVRDREREEWKKYLQSAVVISVRQSQNWITKGGRGRIDERRAHSLSVSMALLSAPKEERERGSI